MGRDKARLHLGGRTLLERALAALDGACDEVVLCCGALARYEDAGRELVLDLRQGGGPLAGVEAALARLSAADLLLVVPVDLPGLAPEVPRRLLGELRDGHADAVFARSSRGLEPLVSAWRAGAIVEVRKALDLGERRMVAPFRGLSPSGALRLQEVCFDACSGPGSFDNLNTPLDWERAALETGGAGDALRSPRPST